MNRSRCRADNVIIAFTFAVLLVANGAPSVSPEAAFTGRWRFDTESFQSSNALLRIVLDKRGFTRATNSEPASATKVDGTFHRAEGSGYVDETRIEIVSPNEVRETNRVKGQIVYVSRYVLSPDGKTLTWFVTSFANKSQTAVDTRTIWQLVSRDSGTAHQLNGKWTRSGVRLAEGASDWILKLDGGTFSNRTPQGSGYEARVGGPSVSIDGDSAGATASVVMPDRYTVVENNALKGVIGAILILQASPDGSSIKGIAVLPKTGAASTFLLKRTL
jgi:hypothetical protein